MIKMADTNLPWLLLGRRVRPYAIALSLACASVAYSLLIRGSDIGDALDKTIGGYIIGSAALICIFFFWVGFWIKSDALMRHGLLIASGVFAARWMVLTLDDHLLALTGLLSGCWAIASAGAYLLEVVAPKADSRGRV
mgnify:CR=1 FL=1